MVFDYFFSVQPLGTGELHTSIVDSYGLIDDHASRQDQPYLLFFW